MKDTTKVALKELGKVVLSALVAFVTTIITNGF